MWNKVQIKFVNWTKKYILYHQENTLVSWFTVLSPDGFSIILIKLSMISKPFNREFIGGMIGSLKFSIMFITKRWVPLFWVYDVRWRCLSRIRFSCIYLVSFSLPVYWFTREVIQEWNYDHVLISKRFISACWIQLSWFWL